MIWSSQSAEPCITFPLLALNANNSVNNGPIWTKKSIPHNCDKISIHILALDYVWRYVLTAADTLERRRRVVRELSKDPEQLFL